MKLFKKTSLNFKEYLKGRLMQQLTIIYIFMLFKKKNSVGSFTYSPKEIRVNTSSLERLKLIKMLADRRFKFSDT